MINTIIWDWNGTLLNDTDICIASMNIMLKSRKLPSLTKERYRQIFAFPVRNYYLEAGFDFDQESFDIVAMEFMDLYFDRLSQADIFEDTKQALRTFQEMNILQVLISAMEHEALVSSVKEKGLFDCFDHISGIHDHFASGKAENAKKTMNQLNPDLSNTILIGDTIHDFEVAQELGVECLLVSRGHQSEERLNAIGCGVFRNLKDIVAKIKIENPVEIF